MFIVRDVLIAKPGSAGKLAKLMKETTPPLLGKTRIMIDFVTDFNKIVLEHEVEDLAEFEKEMADFKANAELKAKMAGYTDLYLTGKREIYKVLD